MVRAAAEGVTGYQRAFRGQADQLSLVRHDVARHLAGCPAAADVVLIASELAANSVLHSRSRGGLFTVRVEVHADHALIECEDLGGPWRRRKDDSRPHGLDIVAALAGPGGWGVRTASDGARITWARLALSV